MFTGIVTRLGKFVSMDIGKDPVLLIKTEIETEILPGDSVAVNGACLSLTESANGIYKFNVSGETLSRTNFRDLSKGDLVNLELPVTPETMLGGHLVSGHIDGTARLRRVEKKRGSVGLLFSFTEREWFRFLINKGSVTVNGVSLTVSDVSSSSFSVEIIPLTLEKTNLKFLKPGERVNIELDLVGKYLYNFSLKKV